MYKISRIKQKMQVIKFEFILNICKFILNGSYEFGFRKKLELGHVSESRRWSFAQRQLAIFVSCRPPFAKICEFYSEHRWCWVQVASQGAKVPQCQGSGVAGCAGSILLLGNALLFWVYVGLILLWREWVCFYPDVQQSWTWKQMPRCKLKTACVCEWKTNTGAHLFATMSCGDMKFKQPTKLGKKTMPFQVFVFFC